MCTNGIYQCEDLSRIDCTEACKYPGRIECKNYDDLTICSSFNKKGKCLSNLEWMKLNSSLKKSTINPIFFSFQIIKKKDEKT
jgi:hypothetical protein